MSFWRCKECEAEFEEAEIISCSLDFVDQDPGMDHFCPECFGEEIYQLEENDEHQETDAGRG